MKVRIAVFLSMALGIAMSLLALRSAWTATQAWENRAIAAEELVGALESRFDDLDRSMARIDEETRANRKALDRQLADLRNIQPTEGDSDETLECLDLPVPRALDGLLRRALTGSPVSD